MFKSNPTYSEDAKKIMATLVKLGFSKMRIAKMLNVPPNYIFRWETSKVGVSEYYRGLFWKLAELVQRYRGTTPASWRGNIERDMAHYISTPVVSMAKVDKLARWDNSEASIYARHRAEVLREYPYCQLCGTTTRGVECHHIYYRSETMNHKRKHAKRNLIILCPDCHRTMHEKKGIRELLVKDRNLDLFFKDKDGGTDNNQTD